ncbi:MAG: sugar ABC transporter permease [Clostridiales bacterium]|nr:sugar ABC transporter permease [Clostridiales bacterium]
MLHLLKRILNYWNTPRRAAFVFIIPSAVLLILFVFLPLLGTLVFAFFDMDIFFNNISFLGLENFVRFFKDQRAINSMLHTFYYSIWEVPLQVIVGLLLAVALQKNSLFNKFCRSIFFIPVVCSTVSVSIIWKIILSNNIGFATYLISQMGITAPGFLTDAKYALPTVALTTVWKNFGMTLVILLAGIQSISPSLYESAEIDGANAKHKFFRITIPQLLPSIGFCLLTNFIGSMQVFDAVFLMTGGGPQFRTETAVQYIYVRGFSAPYQLGYASAVSWILFIIIAVITMAMNLFLNKKERQYN